MAADVWFRRDGAGNLIRLCDFAELSVLARNYPTQSRKDRESQFEKE
jgi:hypothetical protein